MRETRADTTHAFWQAVALHAVLLFLIVFGLRWTRDSAPPAGSGEPMVADMVQASDLSAATRRALAKTPTPPKPEPVPEPDPEPVVQETQPPPQPVPEPAPQIAEVAPQQQAQQQVPDPQQIDQDAVKREAIAAESAEREQEEKRRQQQIDLTERERQAQAEQKQRLTAMELDRQAQLADIRRQRAAATREAQLAEDKLKQLADRRAQQASASAAASTQPAGNPGVEAGLSDRYAEALREAILRNWTRPDSVPLGQRCSITIRQLPGGEVVEVQIAPSCPYDELGRRSVEAAVLKAQPLPYAGFEAVFQRTLPVNFQAQDR